MNRPERRLIRAIAPFAVAASLVPSAQAQTDAVQGEELVVEDIVAWVNDDIVRASETTEQEAAFMAQMMRSGRIQENEIESRLEQVRATVTLRMIQDLLLVQQAENLFKIEDIEKDLLQQFMDNNQIESQEELDRRLESGGLSREQLTERLVRQQIPNYVLRTMLRDRIGISEEETRAWYEANATQFTTPASVTFREIVLNVSSGEDPDEVLARANEIVDEARGGAPFVDLVRERSEAPSKAIDGLIGPLEPGDLVQTVATAALETSVGGVSDPVRTATGWHVLLVEERVEATTAPFDEVRDAIEEELRSEKLREQSDGYLRELWEQSSVEVRRAYAERLVEPWIGMTTIRD